MIKTILIFKLLILLALQPVGAAYMASASLSGQIGSDSHQGMKMDCEQMDPASCTDMGACMLLGHSSCDSHNAGIVPDFKTHNGIALNPLNATDMQDYLQPQTETPQRPPRNA